MASKNRQERRNKVSEHRKQLNRAKRAQRDNQEVIDFAQQVRRHTTHLMMIALNETLGIGDQRFARVMERFNQLADQSLAKADTWITQFDVYPDSSSPNAPKM